MEYCQINFFSFEPTFDSTANTGKLTIKIYINIYD